MVRGCLLPRWTEPTESVTTSNDMNNFALVVGFAMILQFFFVLAFCKAASRKTPSLDELDK